MDRRQIQDVESQPRDVIEALFAVGKSAVPPGLRCAGSREHLVPRAAPCQRPVDHDLQFERIGRTEAAVGIAQHEAVQLVGGSKLAPRLQRAVLRQILEKAAQCARVSALGAGSGRLHQHGADRERERDVLRILAPHEILTPRQKSIDPRRHRVFVAAEFGDLERTAPVVVVGERHLRFLPGAGALLVIPEHAAQRIVAVRKNGGFHRHTIADDALYREAPAVHRRRHRFDHDPAPAVIRQSLRHVASWKV